MKEPIGSAAALVMVVLCLIWGAQQVAMKIVADEVAPLMQMMLRSGIAAVLVWGLARWILRDDWLPGLWRRSGVTVAVLYATQLAFVALGLHWTSTSHMTVLLYTAPLFAAIGLHLRAPAERLSMGQFFGMSLSFAGIVVTFMPSDTGVDFPLGAQLLGDLMGLCAGIAWGMTLVVVRGSRLNEAPATQIMFYQLFGAFLLLLPVVVLTGEVLIRPTWPTLASLGFQAILVAFVTHLIWYWMLQRYVTTSLGMMTFMTPLFAMAMGAWLLSEPLTPGFLLGAAMTLAGLSVANLFARRRGSEKITLG